MLFHKKRFDLVSELVRDFIDNPPVIEESDLHMPPQEIIKSFYTLSINMGRQTGHSAIVFNQSFHSDEVIVIAPCGYNLTGKNVFNIRQLERFIHDDFRQFRGIKHDYKAIIVDGVSSSGYLSQYLTRLSLVLGSTKANNENMSRVLPIVLLGC